MEVTPEAAARPLDGVRVLDFTVFQQGPIGTTLLADLGADVVKVEPCTGELGRRLRGDEAGFSPFFEAHNRGKRSLAVDLKSARGLEIIRRLLPRYDVLAHNFRPGVMEKLGLGYDDVRALRPDIIYVAASGYGPAGPMATAPAFDGTGQALSGLLMAQQQAGGGRPTPALYGIADSIGGLLVAQAAVTGLYARATTGRGQRMDVSIVGGLTFVQAVEIVESLYRKHQPSMRYRMSPTFGPYCGSDGRWFAITTVDPTHWPRLCAALERPDLVDHPQLSRSRWRMANGDETEAVLEAAFATRPRDEWVARITEQDIPCAPVLTYEEMAVHPQVLANGYIQTVEHPIVGPLQVVGPPITVGGETLTPGTAPGLGRDTDAVLRDAGYDPAEIASLREDGIIAV